jgi:hypothetical protein
MSPPNNDALAPLAEQAMEIAGRIIMGEILMVVDQEQMKGPI